MDLDLSDEAKQRELAQNDEEEDFLDDGIINYNIPLTIINIVPISTKFFEIFVQ